MSIEVDIKGLDKVVAQLRAAGARAGVVGFRLVSHHGQKLQAKVKANASGRPGPRIQTGDYNRSITLEVTARGGAVEARVASNRPQAMRLEFGFVGVDSRGRSYSQPPFPHFQPAAKAIEPAFRADVLEMAAQLMGR